ncbi:hypothetical protein [Actinobaculum sp. 313]|uniref:AlbA family DNA-binding domain-containing protein n=1 Tax=Actinobaculum sp. 313 TaxID=2495645 RepID=UPI00196B6751|nr:hypothetical protein [Actinobaculum sp. 313]
MPSFPDRLLRTIVAFVSSAGGRLVVVASDDCTVVGISDPLKEEERLASLIDVSDLPAVAPATDPPHSRRDGF